MPPHRTDPHASSGAGESALAMEDIGKSFPGVRALEGVSFDCRSGEVHAICGENGAGKSTLIKILGGIVPAGQWEIRIDGKTVTLAHPAAARRAGIGIIHQELSLLPDRSVAENILLGNEPARRGVLDRPAMHDRRAARSWRGSHPRSRRGAAREICPWPSSRWSRSPRRSPPTRASWSWTSPRRRWTTRTRPAC